jgi:hypothetical protein
MKLAMVISQTNPEQVFNAFRLANFSDEGPLHAGPGGGPRRDVLRKKGGNP